MSINCFGDVLKAINTITVQSGVFTNQLYVNKEDKSIVIYSTAKNIKYMKYVYHKEREYSHERIDKYMDGKIYYTMFRGDDRGGFRSTYDLIVSFIMEEKTFEEIKKRLS